MNVPELTLQEPTSPAGEVPANTPLVINGLTVRPRQREPVDMWLWLLCLLPLPAFAGLLVAIGVGSHFLAQHLTDKIEREV